MNKPLVSVLIADISCDDSLLERTVTSAMRQGDDIEVIVLRPESSALEVDSTEVRNVKVNTFDEAHFFSRGLNEAFGEYFLYVRAGAIIEKEDIQNLREGGITDSEQVSVSDYFKETGIVSRCKEVNEDTGQRFIRVLQSGVVDLVRRGALAERVEEVGDFVDLFLSDEDYGKKASILQDLRTSRIWKLVAVLRRVKQAVYGSKGGKLIHHSILSVTHPKRTISLYRQAKKEALLKEKYNQAWVITDRPDQASDNGILFYEYLAENHPEVNIHYVISDTAADFEILKNRGVKIISHGSKEHKNLTRHADVEMSAFFNFAPFDLSQLGREKPLKRVFILHGMDQSDLSLHYSRLGMDMYCVVTQESYDFYKSSKSIVDIRDRNIQLTGMVRYDLIRKMSSQIEKSERRKIVIAPTWRRFLLYKPGTTEKVPEGTLPKSKYCQYYTELFNSVELKELSQRYEIVLIPHPEMLHRIDEFSVPEFITVKTYKELGTKKLYEIALGTKLFISDFSSTTFDFAFLGANVAYFNFDEEDYYSEKQDLYRSWFSIDKDGFGPSIKAIDGLKKYLKSGRWVRREENITKVWSQIPENSSETLYKKISELLEDK